MDPVTSTLPASFKAVQVDKFGGIDSMHYRDVPLVHPAAGQVRMVANPIRFSATPITHEVAPPLLGQHTAEVLSGVLGVAEAEIARLRREGIA